MVAPITHEVPRFLRQAYDSNGWVKGKGSAAARVQFLGRLSEVVYRLKSPPVPCCESLWSREPSPCLLATAICSVPVAVGSRTLRL